MAYGDFKDLPRRAASDKVLCNKVFNIPANWKYDGCQRGLASMVYKFFDKKSLNHTVTEINSNSDSENQQLAENYASQLLESLKNVK